ncbi:MAG: ABC transporter permease [Methanosarcinaceae archaeon]|nr:ABC transporter permease [Methanosarcinaceae archaeon]
MYEMKIALRHVLSRRRQAFFSILAVALAVAVITVMMGLLTGFQNELIQASIENSPHIIINPKSDQEEFIHLYKQLAEQLAEKEGVIAVSPKYLGQAALEYRENAEAVSLQGVEPLAEDRVLRVSKDVIAGDFKALSHSKSGILLGDKLAENLEVKVGDRVDAGFPGSKPTSFKVIGLFHTGTPADEALAYARLDSVQAFFNEKGVVSSIGIRVNDPYQAESLAMSIEEETGFEAVSWIEANAEILNLLNTQKVFVNLFYLMIYGIAGFGIANTLITVVAQRTPEIGILKAMGASKKSITKVFLFQALLLGSAGLCLGCVLGYLTTLYFQRYYIIDVPQEMYFGLQTLPIELDFLNFALAAIFALLVNLLAGVYPARKAAGLDAVEAIESA